MNLSMSSFSRASTTLHSHAVKSLPTSSSRSQFAVSQNSRARSSHITPYEDEARSSDFDAARQWYSQFRRSTIPVTIAQTSFSKSSGPGGQKTNKLVSWVAVMMDLADSVKDEFEGHYRLAVEFPKTACAKSASLWFAK